MIIPAQNPVRVMVDAAQSVGSLELNLPELAIDYYAFTGHKWLCGPAGVGGLYISQESVFRLESDLYWLAGGRNGRSGKTCSLENKMGQSLKSLLRLIQSTKV